jgi:hypothetical protein
MKRLFMVVVLSCALSGVALAGEMPISGIAPPESSTTQTSIATTVVLALVSLLSR